MFFNRCNNKCTFDLIAPVKKGEKARNNICYRCYFSFLILVESFFSCLKFKCSQANVFKFGRIKSKHLSGHNVYLYFLMVCSRFYVKN